jgi:hypothetical protein
MNKFLIAILLLFLTQGTFAQLKGLGTKAGVNYSSILYDKTFTKDGIDFTYAKEDANVGVVLGFFGRGYIRKTFIQPEFLFSKHNYSTKISSINFDTLRQINLSRVDVPIMIGYSKKDRFRIMMGPVYTKQMEYSPFEDGFYDSDMKNFFKSGSWAVQAGIGFDIGSLCFDLRYETNLSAFGDKVEVRGRTYKFDYRSSVIQLTVGIDFKHYDDKKS